MNPRSSPPGPTPPGEEPTPGAEAAGGARKAELVRLRYFGGLSFEEAAEVLEIAVPTAKQWMAYARAWFKVEMTRCSTEFPTSSPSDPGAR